MQGKKQLWALGPLVAAWCLQPATAQVDLGFDVRQGTSSSLSTPSGVMRTLTVAHCVTDNLLAGDLAAGPASNSLASFFTPGISYSGSFSANGSVRFLSEPVEGIRQACLGFTGTPAMPFANCPEPTFLDCDATEADSDDYYRLDFAAGASVSSTSTLRRRAGASIRVVDDLIVDSPVAQMLELPITVRGMVTGAESFGVPSGCIGAASLGVTGTVFGTTLLNTNISVVSVTTIPTTATINQTFLYPLTVPAGVTVHSIDVTLAADMDARAQGSFLIVGAATAGVIAPSYVRIERLRTAGGGPLAAGTRVIGGLTGTVYEDVAEVASPYRVVPGCTTHQAVLYPTAAGAPVPGQMDLGLRSSQLADGAAVLFGGLDGTDPYGCGLFTLFGGEDVLLAPGLLIDLGVSTIAGGLATPSVPIPNNPILSGVELMLQAIDVGTVTPGIELSTALVVTFDG